MYKLYIHSYVRTYIRTYLLTPTIHIHYNHLWHSYLYYYLLSNLWDRPQRINTEGVACLYKPQDKIIATHSDKLEGFQES